MNCISFPAESLSPQTGDTLYLDSSFVLSGLALHRNCADLLQAFAGHSMYASPVVWAEVVHVLVRTYVAGDLSKLMVRQAEGLVHPMTAPELMSLWMRGKAREGLLNMKRASDEAMKSPSARLRALLIPYQQSAMGALERFLEASGVSLLSIGPEALRKAKTICEVAPCDTNDALHLAVALTSGCSYAVTKDADWGRVPATLRPVVLQVA